MAYSVNQRYPTNITSEFTKNSRRGENFKSSYPTVLSPDSGVNVTVRKEKNIFNAVIKE